MLTPFATVAEAIRFGYTVADPYLVRASARIRSVIDVPEVLTDAKEDALAELTCSIASRLQSADTSEAGAKVAAGVTTEAEGPFSTGYGFDSYKAASGLTAGEWERLRAILPPVPRLRLMTP